MQLQRENIGKNLEYLVAFVTFTMLKTFCEGAFIIILIARFLLQPFPTA